MNTVTLHALKIEIMDQSGAKPWIKGRYDLREVEPTDYSISRTYRDRQIKYLQMHTNAY